MGATSVSRVAVCANCDTPIPMEMLEHAGVDAPCPACSGTARVWSINVADAVQVRDNMKAKSKRDTFPSKKKVRLELQTGEEIRRDGRGWVTKDRIIDHDADSYIEKVVDSDTGLVLRDVAEPLSEHRGHGSARRKTKS